MKKHKKGKSQMFSSTPIVILLHNETLLGKLYIELKRVRKVIEDSNKILAKYQ